MSSRPLFYFPLFAPPIKAGTDPSTYYSGLGTTAIVAPEPDGSLAITFPNPQTAYAADQVDHAMSLAAVFAPTRGFLTFYPAAAALPTPDLQPLTLPVGVQPPDVGTLVLRVWAADHRRLGSTIPAGAIRPTHILIGGARGDEVETALAPVIATLPEKALIKAWQDAGGTGTVPDKAALKTAYLQRVMSNSAEIFVSAGAHIGATTTIDDAATTATLGWMLLRTFGPDAQSVLTNTDAMTFLDDIFAATGSGAAGSIYDDHPLVVATSAEQTIHFQCQMMIWDNALTPTSTYVPFTNGQVTLVRNGQVEGSAIPTDANGYVVFTADLSPRDKITFEYSTIGHTVGTRLFTTNVQTEAQRLGLVLGTGATVVTQFRAKYEVFAEYFAFWESLRQDEAVEKFGADRGNSQSGLKSYENQERWLFKVLVESERKYRTGAVSPSHFNVLYEGDSWLFYPRSKDIYQWLHEFIPQGLDPQFQYNAFPLQHFGDRTDQMFAASAPVVAGSAITSGGRQWQFTQEYLSEFPIDLIVLSAGGNDIAEPGISAGDKSFFPGMFNGDTFDALGANTLPPDKIDIATNLMQRSFSILLRNHPWNVAASSGSTVQKTSSQIDADFDARFTALGDSYGGRHGKRSDVAEAVRSNWPAALQFPYNISTAHDQFLDSVYDSARLAQRLDRIRDNIETLVQEAATYGIPVVAHSTSYPFYNEEPTKWTDVLPVAGPWFANRFVEANLLDPRVKLIALKGLVDSYCEHVLEKLKTLYPSTFSYADIREDVMDAALWNDEMHLKNEGFRRVSVTIYNELARVWASQLVPR